MIAKTRAPAAAADAGAAVVPEGQPRRSAGDVPRAAVGHAAAVDDQRVRARRRSRSGSRWSAASPRSQVFGAAEVRGARRPGSAPARRLRHRHRRGRHRDLQRQREPADRHHLRRGQTFTVLANGQLLRAAAYGPTIIAYRNGNPVRLDEVAHVYDGVENDKTAGLVQTASAAMLSWRSRSSPAPTSSRWSTRVKALLPTFREQLPAAVTLDIRSDRVGADPRVGARREVDAAAHRRPGRAGDLPLPPEHLGDDHSEPGAARLDRRAPSR